MQHFPKRLIALVLILILLIPAAVQADQDTPATGVLPCTYSAPSEVQSYIEHLYDGKPDTTVTLYRGESLTITFPEGTRADYLYFDFYEIPQSYELVFLDADGNTLKRNPTGEIRGVQQLIPVDYDDAASAVLKATDKTMVLSEWFACTSAFVPPFSDTNEHADVLIVMNKPGDELELFGGLLAQLAGEHGLSVQVVYMTKVDGFHMHQCIDVLRGMGVTRLPVFRNGRANTIRSDSAVYSAFGAHLELLRQFTKLIRSLQPKLILTPNRSRDQESYTDSVIAELVITSAEYAADGKHYPDSEPFAPSKVYSLCEDDGTTVSMEDPLYGFDGATAAEIADALHELYLEERIMMRKLPTTVHFMLEQSTVGADEARNDLLEHLSTDLFAGYRAPTPAPTETPVPTDTPEPTETPTATPSATPVPGESATPAARSGLFSCAGKEETPLPTEEPTPEPTKEPTPEPIEEPTPEPTEEPTPEPIEEPTPDPDAAYFSEEEIYELDFKEGHWWYKNRILSVDIHRIKTKLKSGGPLVYYVADIRMRDYSSYRSGVHSGYSQPWSYSRQEKAVFAITGDNLDVADKNLKGCIIRKGKYYYNAGYTDTLVIDGLSMYVLPRREVSSRVLLDHGVRDTYSFGPTLVENGEVNPNIHKHHVNNPNPRCGIGMIEPGHWIAIVTDGRQSVYSHSISLEHFATMFHELGCTVAYNMDGGASAAMCIMGETINKHIAPNTIDSQRPWIDAFMIGYSENVPSPNVPTIHDGYHH